MKPVRYFFPILVAAGLTASCSAGQKKSAEETPSKYALMAAETMDSIYARYGVDGEKLLRENYPNDEFYRATYLVGDDNNSPKPYSYLWPYSSTVSAVRALYDATGDSAYRTLLKDRVTPGLEQYLDTARMPAAYASYISSAPQSDRFYDDNIWLGIDYTDFYLGTKDPEHLDKARMIWKFIESGTDDKLGGGIYWCEQKKGGKNTCSNAPGSVYALKLFKATGDSAYLAAGANLYDWTKANLQDTTDHLYFDHKLMNGKIGRAKFAYNSGQMMQAATLLYDITGEKRYLTDAQEIAESAYRHFFSRTATDSIGDFPLIKNGDIWFTAVMMRGFHELFLADGNPQYMDNYLRNLDYAWEHARDTETGLFNSDWSGTTTDERKGLLTQGAMAEMFATAAIYQSENDKQQ